MNFLCNVYIIDAIKKTTDAKENPLRDIIDLLREIFGNRFDLENTGLNSKLRELKERVREDKLIGLVLWALKEEISETDNFITNYTNPSRVNMKLTVTSICECLIIDHIFPENIKAFCDDLN